MTRAERMQRIADLLDKQEQQARQELAAANRELDEAERSLREVFEQCRAVAADGQELSVAFGRVLIESGWLTAIDRSDRRDRAEAEAEGARASWQARRTRLDALTRLVARLGELEEQEAAKRLERELTDIVMARRALIGAAGDDS